MKIMNRNFIILALIVTRNKDNEAWVRPYHENKDKGGGIQIFSSDFQSEPQLRIPEPRNFMEEKQESSIAI